MPSRIASLLQRFQSCPSKVLGWTEYSFTLMAQPKSAFGTLSRGMLFLFARGSPQTACTRSTWSGVNMGIQVAGGSSTPTSSPPRVSSQLLLLWVQFYFSLLKLKTNRMTSLFESHLRFPQTLLLIISMGLLSLWALIDRRLCLNILLEVALPSVPFRSTSI